MPVFSIHGRKHAAKAFLFDKDGTLLDLSHWAGVMVARAEELRRRFSLDAPAASRLLELMGVYPRTKAVLSRDALLRPRREVEEIIAGAVSAETGISRAQALEEVRKIFVSVDRGFPWERYLRTTPGASELLSAIKEAGGKIGVITHDSTFPAALHLKHVKLDKFVDVVIGLDKAPAPKPDPGGIYVACTPLGVRPQDAVMVGDGPEDVGAGKAAGCALTIGVLTGKGNARDLAEADYIVETLGEIEVLRPK